MVDTAAIEVLTLHVEGMTSSHEAQSVEKKLRALVGVVSLDVDVASSRVRISYQPSVVTVQDLIRSISETGLNASVARKRRLRSTWWREKQQLALYACGFLILVAVGVKYLFHVPPLYSNAIYVLAVLAGVYYPARKAIIALLNLTPTIHLLMLIGSGGAMVLGLWQESAILIFVYSLGDVLESYAVDKARGALRALAELMPKEALVRRGDGEVPLPTEEIRVGDVVIVRAGERIPVDGEVLAGVSFVDQAAVTGESLPVRKKAGSEVFAGTMNQSGSLEIGVTTPVSETMLSKIITSVEEAQARRTSYQRFSDAFAKYYTPAMLVLGVLVAVIPPLFFGADWRAFIYRGLVVFVVSCSCGLALSVPVAVVAAMANAARHGTAFKGGSYLESVSRVKAMAFDKTGTLTVGRPEVTDVVTPSGSTEDEEAVLALAAGVECRSSHPIAAAIVRSAKEKGVFNGTDLEHCVETAGRGIAAQVDGSQIVVGSIRFQREHGVGVEGVQEEVERLEAQGKTVVLVSRDQALLGVVGVADKVRPAARRAIAQLRNAGIRTIMLSGDNRLSAEAVAREVGVDECYAQLLPTDKVELVREIKARHGTVAMVGDGINDAPAMAVSDVGIAMGAAGSDIAVETGDVVLMSDDLLKLDYVRELSRRTINTIKQNIVISLVNIAFMVVMALMGLFGLVTGLLLNEASAVLVILNALRLLNWKNKKTASRGALDVQEPAATTTRA